MKQKDPIKSIIPLDDLTSAMMNAMDAHIAIMDEQGTILAYNREWKAGQEEIEDNWSHPDLGVNILQSLQDPLSNGNDFALRLLLGIKDVLNESAESFETRHMIRHKDYRNWFKVTVKPLSEPDRFLIVYENMSGQPQNQKYFKEAQNKFNSYFNNSIYGIIITDENFVILEANRRASELLELPSDIIPFTNANRYFSKALSQQQLRDHLQEQDSYITELELVTAEEKVLPIQLSINSFKNEQGEVFYCWSFQDHSAQKEAEISIIEQNRLYELQFKNSLAGTIIGCPDGLILKANPAACKILGYEEGELHGKHRDLVFDSSVPVNQEAIRKRNENGYYAVETEMIHKEGHLIPVEILSMIIPMEDGQDKTIVNIRDISSQKSMQRKIQQEQEFTNSAICSLPTAFFVFDSKGNMVRWNKVLEQELGYSGEEIKALNALDLVYPEDRPILEQVLQSEFNGSTRTFDARCLAKSGNPVHYLISGTSFVQDDKTYLLGSAINQTELLKIDTERKKNSTLLNQLFFNSPIGIVLIDKDGEVQNSNKSFEKIFGYTKEELTGKKLDEVIVPDYLDDHAKSLTCMSFTGDSFQTETIRLHKNGSEIPVMVGGVPVEVDGEFIAIYGMYLDISERKALENQIMKLLDQEKDARLHMQDMFEEAPSAIAMLIGNDLTYKFANETYRKLVGREQLLGKKVADVIPEFEEQGLIQLLRNCLEKGETHVFNEKALRFHPDNDKPPYTRILNFVYKPLFDEHQKPYGIFVQAIDVTEQVEARKFIERSLEEKEILLGEVHHRVKNNLAIISGLIELEKFENSNLEVSKFLHATQSRIYTIAAIHELLYQSESLSHIQFDEYLDNVIHSGGPSDCGNIYNSIHTYELEPVELNVNQAIPAGMLINETLECLNNLVTNPDEIFNEQLSIELRLSHSDDLVQIRILNIQNQVKEFREKVEQSNTSLHYDLVNSLIVQLQGEITYTDNGLNFSFEKKEVKGAHSALQAQNKA